MSQVTSTSGSTEKSNRYLNLEPLCSCAASLRCSFSHCSSHITNPGLRDDISTIPLVNFRDIDRKDICRAGKLEHCEDRNGWSPARLETGSARGLIRSF